MPEGGIDEQIAYIPEAPAHQPYTCYGTPPNLIGEGSPEGRVFALCGWHYWDLTANSDWVKEGAGSTNTGWVAASAGGGATGGLLMEGGSVSKEISDFTDGVTANATDRIAAARSPFGAGDNVYITPSYLSTFIGAGSSVPLTNSWFTFVGGKATVALNGADLLAGYAAGILKTPGGNPLSATNRHTIILTPGVYDVSAGGPLALATQFVDLVGLSPNNGLKMRPGIATYDVGEVVISSSGIAVNKTVDDVWMSNLAIKTTSNALATPAFDTTGTFVNEKFINCIFTGTGGANSRGMEQNVAWSGYYEDCTCHTQEGFGSGAAGVCSGIFVRCISSGFSFASGAVCSGLFLGCEADGASFGHNAVCSGTFIDCRYRVLGISTSGTASPLFGGSTSGVASGVFIRCVAEAVADSFGGAAGSTAGGTFLYCRGGAGAFGGNSTGTGGIASGAFRYCIATNNAFGGGTTTGGTASGTFFYCIGGNNCYGGGSTNGGTAGGTFLFCEGDDLSYGAGAGGTATGVFRNCRGDDNSFAGLGGTASGSFIYCNAGNGAFGGNTGGVGGAASGTFFFCFCGSSSFGGGSTTGGTTGGVYYQCRGNASCFGGGTTTGGTASGTFVGCFAFGASSFGGGGTTGGSASGVFRQCVSNSVNCFGGGGTTAGTMSGTMHGCSLSGRLNSTVTGTISDQRIVAGSNQSALLLATGAAIYNVTAIAAGTGNSFTAAAAATCVIAHCRSNLGMHANITNSIATPYNVDDTDIA